MIPNRPRNVRAACSFAMILTIICVAHSVASADDQVPANRPGPVGGATAEPTVIATSSPSVIPASPGTQPQMPPATVEVRTYGIYSFRSTWNGDADVQASHAGTAVDLAIPIAVPVRLDVSIIGEYSHYGFSDTGAVLPTPRFAIDGYALAIQPTVGLALSEKFAFFAGPTVQSTAQFGANFQRSMTYGGDIGAYYKVDPKLSITLGIGGSTRLSHAAYFYPVIGVDWELCKELRCTIQTQDFGATARLSRTLCPNVSLSLIGGYAQREYRLNNMAAEPGGLLRDFYVPIGMELAYVCESGPSIRLDVGTSIVDNIRFDDRSGNKVSRHNADAAPFIALAAAWKF